MVFWGCTTEPNWIGIPTDLGFQTHKLDRQPEVDTGLSAELYTAYAKRTLDFLSIFTCAFGLENCQRCGPALEITL